MPSVGPNFPGAVTQTNLGQGTRLKFDVPENILADDNVVATSAISPATYRLTWIWRMSSWSMNVPAGSVIVGFELTFECNTNLTLTGQCRDGTAQLLVGGVVMGQKLSSGSDWTAGSHTRTIGGAADLWGWTNPPVDDVNAPGFEVRFDCQVASDNSASFDWFNLKVYYTTTTFAEKEGTGGIGLGGAGTHKVTPYTVASGIGLGGEGALRKAKPLIVPGGIGVGGTADWRKARTVSGAGGIGIGGTYTLQKYHYGGNGGIGFGGDGIYMQTLHLTGTGGIGIGGDGLRRSAPILSGGFGIGGAADYRRTRPVSGTGGIGLGGDQNPFGRRRYTVAEGGIGFGGAGTNIITQKYSGRGGLGLGGAVGIRRTLADGTTDPEDEIERSHRGPVTRRMVYDSIRKVLVDGPLNDYAVYIGVDEPEMDAVQGSDNFAVILPSSVNSDQGDAEGYGDYGLGTIRTDICEVRIYSRKSIDQYPRSTAWDLDLEGAMERGRQCRRVLNMNDLIDDAGWLLLTEPMRSTNTNNANIRQKNPQVGYRSEFFEVKYTEYLG